MPLSPGKDAAAERMLRARALGSTEDAVSLYREWAETYDSDVYERLRFTGTRRIAELLAVYSPGNRPPAIDLGCGTGQLGAELKPLGFQPVDGLDLSPEMLAVATARKVYRETIAADLLAPLPVAARQYGAAASAGTFTTGHVDARALDEVLRILVPGGLMAFVVAGGLWEAGGFAARFEMLQGAQRLEMLHRSFEPTRESGEAEAWFLVLRLGEH